MDLFCRPIEIWAGFSCSDRCKPSGGVLSQLSPFSPCLLFSLHVYEEMMYECFLQRRLFYCNSFLFFVFKGRSVRVTVTSFPNNLLNECIKDSRSGTVMARNAWRKFKSILLTCKLLLTCFETLLYPRNLLLKEKKIMIDFSGGIWKLKIRGSAAILRPRSPARKTKLVLRLPFVYTP